MFNLRQARERAGLTQSQLAKALGYTTPQFISNIERDLAFLPPGKFKAASKALAVPVSKMIKAKESMTRAKYKKRYGL